MLKKLLFLLIFVLFLTSAYAYRPALTPSLIDRYMMERNYIAFLNQENNFTETNYFLNGIYIGYMYFNIESSYNEPVIWNISQYPDDVYNFRVRGGREWIISGNELN